MKYRYREPHELKDSGIEWIGKIPKEWKVKRIKHLVKEPLKYGANETAELDDPELPRYIRITDFGDNGKLREDTFKSLDYDKAKNFLLKDGDILFARSGATVGKTFQFKNYEAVACFAGYLIKAAPDEQKILSDYLYQFTKSISYENWKNSIFIKATIQNIGADKYKDFKLSLPNRKQQSLITSFLDKKCTEFDNIIEKKERIISKMEEAKQSLISEVVTGKVKIENGKITPRKPEEMKESGIAWIGKIPKEWEVKKLKNVSELNARKLSENEDPDLEINYVDIGNVNSNGKIEEIQVLRFENAPSRARRIIKNGDTIISTVRTYLKAIAYFEKAEDNLICSTGFAVFSPYLDKFAKKYFYYLISSDRYINQIVRNSVGVSYPAINASQIANFNCFLPKIEQQSLIAFFLDKKTAEIDIAITKTRDQIEKIKKAKQSLISEAVTGKIEVIEEK